MKNLFLFIMLLLPMAASADQSGTCGRNVTWTYNETTHTLMISGSGEMYNYYWILSPWYGNREILSVLIEEGVTSIGEWAFQYCSGLTSVTIPNSVTSIGEQAFYGCSSLTSVTIPNSVTSIGEGAFYECSGLTSVHISDLEAWFKISFTHDVSNPLCYAHHLFLNGEEIKDLVIPNSVTRIGDCAFSGCSGLTSVTIPNSVTSIGNSAFSGCSGLTSLTIPNSVTSIGDWAFSGCRGLTSVTIPNSVTSIGYDAFYNCSGLTSVTIPNSVTSIGEVAFRNCSSLTSVTIPNSVTSIGERAFYGCNKMTALSLSENLVIIKRETFMNCWSLKELVIPAKVEVIYQEAFAGCSGLEAIKVLATTPPFAYDNTFSKYDIPLYVPEESVSAYQAANPWSKFTTFKTLTGGDITPKVCAKPTISYADGQIVFDCETEGVEYQSSITDSDIKSYTSATIQLSAAYTITVVATKSGYQNSVPATATLLWTGATLEEGTNPTRIAEPQGRPILIQSNNGMLTVTGTEAGTPVSVYDTSGRQLATATASGTTTTLPLPSSPLVIVKIGEKSVKVAISNR